MGTLADRNPNLSCSPVIQDKHLWIFTAGGEVICIDVSPLVHGIGLPKELWRFDLLDELGVFMHGSVMGYPTSKSVGGPYKDWIYVITGNGPDWSHSNIPAPLAPALVCLNKDSGKLVWEAETPAKEILHTSLSSPLVIEVNGKALVIASIGDGKLRAYRAEDGTNLWTFDCNPPKYRAKRFPLPDGPSEIVAPPVFYKGKVFTALGQDPEHGEGLGNLVCLDAESGTLIWQTQALNRSLSMSVATDQALYTADFSGFVYCLDLSSRTLRWRYESGAHIWSSPLLVDEHLYIGNEDGNVMIFDLPRIESFLKTSPALFFAPPELSRNQQNLTALAGAQASSFVRTIEMAGPIYASPVFANHTLYVNTFTELFAIESRASNNTPPPAAPSRGFKLPDAVYAPTPPDVVLKMIELARPKKGERLYDLGSGDGRILITAAKEFGCKSVGYELDPNLVQRSLDNAKNNNVSDSVQVRNEDFFNADLVDADIVALYLPAHVLAHLVPQLQKLKPGARIVSHEFKIPGFPPDQTVPIISRADQAEHAIYLWQALSGKWLSNLSSVDRQTPACRLGKGSIRLNLWRAPILQLVGWQDRAGRACSVLRNDVSVSTRRGDGKWGFPISAGQTFPVAPEECSSRLTLRSAKDD
jgi:outer membrane protein assembly factor BamB/SAM-dependent methyltransferase